MIRIFNSLSELVDHNLLQRALQDENYVLQCYRVVNKHLYIDNSWVVSIAQNEKLVLGDDEMIINAGHLHNNGVISFANEQSIISVGENGGIYNLRLKGRFIQRDSPNGTSIPYYVMYNGITF